MRKSVPFCSFSLSQDQEGCSEMGILQDLTAFIKGSSVLNTTKISMAWRKNLRRLAFLPLVLFLCLYLAYAKDYL